MIAPRYVGPSTTTVSPGSRNVLPTSSSASIPPLVITSSSSSGRRPCDDSSRPASASSGPARPRVGAYWNAFASPAEANSWSSAVARSRGKVTRVGKAARERDQVGPPEEAENAAIPSPTSPRVRVGEQLLPATGFRRHRHRARLPVCRGDHERRTIGERALQRRAEPAHGGRDTRRRDGQGSAPAAGTRRSRQASRGPSASSPCRSEPASTSVRPPGSAPFARCRARPSVGCSPGSSSGAAPSPRAGRPASPAGAPRSSRGTRRAAGGPRQPRAPPRRERRRAFPPCTAPASAPRRGRSDPRLEDRA